MADDPRDRITRALQRHALRCPRCQECEALTEIVIVLATQLAAQLLHDGEDGTI